MEKSEYALVFCKRKLVLTRDAGGVYREPKVIAEVGEEIIPQDTAKRMVEKYPESVMIIPMTENDWRDYIVQSFSKISNELDFITEIDAKSTKTKNDDKCVYQYQASLTPAINQTVKYEECSKLPNFNFDLNELISKFIGFKRAFEAFKNSIEKNASTQTTNTADDGIYLK